MFLWWCVCLPLIPLMVVVVALVPLVVSAPSVLGVLVPLWWRCCCACPCSPRWWWCSLLSGGSSRAFAQTDPTLLAWVNRPCCRAGINRKNACAQSSRTFVTSSGESLARAARRQRFSTVHEYRQAWQTPQGPLPHDAVSTRTVPCPTARTPCSSFVP